MWYFTTLDLAILILIVAVIGMMIYDAYWTFMVTDPRAALHFARGSWLRFAILGGILLGLIVIAWMFTGLLNNLHVL